MPSPCRTLSRYVSYQDLLFHLGLGAKHRSAPAEISIVLKNLLPICFALRNSENFSVVFITLVGHIPYLSSLLSCFVSLGRLFTPNCLCTGSSEKGTHLIGKKPLLGPSCYSKHFALNNPHSPSEGGINAPILQTRKLRLSNLLQTPYLVNREPGVGTQAF